MEQFSESGIPGVLSKNNLCLAPRDEGRAVLYSFRIILVSVVILTTLFIPPPCDAEELHIAMILWRGETEAEKGFKEELEGFGYSVNYDIIDAGQSIKKLGVALKELESRLNDFDYVYTFGTTVSRRVRVVLNNRVPQIFNVVTDPVGAGIVDDAMSPGGDISGVSDAVLVKQQVESALELFDIKRLGIIFNPREKNSLIARKELYTFAHQRGIEVVDIRSPPVQQMLDDNLRNLIDRKFDVDAVYLPPDSFLVSQSGLIGSRLKEAKIKSVASVKTFIDHGALVGVVVDYFDLGRAAARIVHRHQRGEHLKDIPVITGSSTYFVINETPSAALGITIPDALKGGVLLVK